MGLWSENVCNTLWEEGYYNIYTHSCENASYTSLHKQNSELQYNYQVSWNV